MSAHTPDLSRVPPEYLAAFVRGLLGIELARMALYDALTEDDLLEQDTFLAACRCNDRIKGLRALLARIAEPSPSADGATATKSANGGPRSEAHAHRG